MNSGNGQTVCQNSLTHYLFAQRQIAPIFLIVSQIVIGWTFSAFIINKDSLTHKVAGLNSLNPNTRHTHTKTNSLMATVGKKNCIHYHQIISPKQSGLLMEQQGEMSVLTQHKAWPPDQKYSPPDFERPRVGKPELKESKSVCQGAWGEKKNCKQCAAFKRTVHTLQIQSIM